MALRKRLLPHCLPALAIVGVVFNNASAAIQHVIAISVDGGRGDFIKTFIDTAPTEFPNFTRLRQMSAVTFNARCDYTHSITIPDHLCMLTGRPVQTPAGLLATTPHGITSDAPGATETAHNSGSNSGVYKASIFDVVHDRGLSSALYMGKNRLQICDRSWNAMNGAPDVIGPDNGQDKIDVGSIVEAMGNANVTPGFVTAVVMAIQTNTLSAFTMLHFADTDYAGHSGGWSTNVGSTYRNMMKTADGWIGQVLDALQSNTSLAGKVAILLTADHGGGSGTGMTINTHTDATRVENYTIPFFVSAPGLTGGSNLYAYFENRADPGTTRPTYTDTRQPFRNGDVANLSAALLGLPAVPGSLMIPELIKPLTIASAGIEVFVSWPVYLTAWALEFSDDLAAWQTVTDGIAETNGELVYSTTAPPNPRFFRLRRPVGF